MSVVKPFADHGHYTAIHDAVFDVVMPFCPPNAFKVLMFVLRKTRGWKKEEDVLSYSQVKAGTGIRSDATLAKELDWLLGKKLLLVRESSGEERTKGNRKAPAYSINRGFKLSVATSENGVRPNRSTSENEAVATSENEETRTRRSQEPQTSSLTNVREEGESDESPVPGDEEKEPETPVGDRSVSERQSYYIGYLADRLNERELLSQKPLTGAYKGRLAGELRNHINAGMRHAAILLTLDKIVHRWSEKRLDFYAASDDADELSRRRGAKEKTTADREYDDAFRATYDGYASDFSDQDNPGLRLMNPDGLKIGERCFHRGQRYRCDEDGVVWAGRAIATYVEPRNPEPRRVV